MKKRILLIVLAALSAGVLFMIGMTSAYFTDVEVKENVITIGKVSVELDESPFDPSKPHDVVPGSKTEKAPKLTNNGNKDEFVFLKITVPKADVTLLYETGENRGTPKTGLTGTQQLFHVFANNTPVETLTSHDGKDIDISYHAGNGENDGWVLLETTSEDNNKDTYVFGYNKLMKPDDETVTLFDSVQLKSFIDSQVKGDVTIGVSAYGIQADNLQITPAIDLEKTRYNDTELNSIYTIVKNKANA